MLRQRTESEMKAYVDGYTACALMFAEYLKDSQDRKDIVNTINNMRIIVQAVEHTVYKEDTDVRQD